MWKQKGRDRGREREEESLETGGKMKEWLDTCSNRWEREREREGERVIRNMWKKEER